MGYELRDGFGELILYEYVRHRYRNKAKKETVVEFYDTEDYTFLFGIYITMEHEEFVAWLDGRRMGERRALTDYQSSYYAFLKEMVEDIYGIEDKWELGMSFIDGDGDRPEVIMVNSMLPNFDAIFWVTTYLMGAILKVRRDRLVE